MSEYHTPVLLAESVDGLNIKEDGTYIDATFGGGGHTTEILSHLGQKGKIISFDKDSDALQNAPKDKRLTLINNNFRFIQNFIHYMNIEYVDGILADLGVSSHQFDTSERGFSFRFDTQLDMRMNRKSGTSAKEVINNYPCESLSRIFRLYGELNNANKIAQCICNAREEAQIATTGDLNRVVDKFSSRDSEHKFLAKLYQAIRIEVNMEMRALEDFLYGAGKLLKKNGRLSIITYHSLEDRMVKNYIKSGNTDGIINKDFFGKIEVPYKNITGKPITPDEEEISRNPRSRSAKLRIAEKI